MTLEHKRLVIYGIAFLLGLSIEASVRPRGMVYWSVVGPSIAVTLLPRAAPRLTPGFALQAAVLTSSLAGLFGPDGGVDLGSPMHTPLDLLPAIVLALGSRLLAAQACMRHRLFYAERDLASAAAPRQSVLAAVLLGIALTRLFYGLFDLQAPSLSDPALGVIVTALSGTTIIHHGIVALFFVISAFLIDAVLLQLGDRAAARWVLSCAGDGRDALQRALAREGHRGVIHLMAEVLTKRREPQLRDSDDTLATLALEQASRRFVRGLVPLLPLLGFLGTVIGLARALGDLRLGQDGVGVPDFSGVLSGLAVKFETTLLGLVTSMFASLMLGWLDKQGAEFSAECMLAASRLSETDEIGV